MSQFDEGWYPYVSDESVVSIDNGYLLFEGKLDARENFTSLSMAGEVGDRNGIVDSIPTFAYIYVGVESTYARLQFATFDYEPALDESVQWEEMAEFSLTFHAECVPAFLLDDMHQPVSKVFVPSPGSYRFRVMMRNRDRDAYDSDADMVSVGSLGPENPAELRVEVWPETRWLPTVVLKTSDRSGDELRVPPDWGGSGGDAGSYPTPGEPD